MNFSGLSNNSVWVLHALIREALEKDNASPESKPYGVREHAGWRDQADAIEKELTRREMSFAPIRW